MFRILSRLLTALTFGVFAASAHAQTFETPARAAYVYDVSTGTVLLSKNAQTALPPASMSKLMTIYMAFEAIADGRLSIDDELLVSQHAMDYQGSSMFLRAGERVSVEDLIRGVIVLSGNDASAVLAENLSPDGTEAGFAQMMTTRAQQMGMVNSTFANSNGWPHPLQRMSVEDLGILANAIIRDFPTFYPIFSEESFAFDGRVPSNSQNRNPILGLGLGADGLKTGHTQEAGYGLVGSAKQGDRRVIFVITGLESAASRAEESERILNWAFRQFAQKDVIAAGTRVAEADVWMGQSETVGLTVAEDVSMLIPILNQGEVAGDVEFSAPLEAPIVAGQEVGELVIKLDNLPERRFPLIAESDVARGGFTTRVKTAALVLLDKIVQEPTEASADNS
ncbi:D-alanyl-D-alanine carboxypeptidase [Marivivens niveibacter]|uniref:serine-type D-Ala-D-Ala carboxypeptidase n=1 Tax=Marivivens niveibacter TaxID=1930667 RepID=A0A251X2P1_9RHOB|nr:D-alanyl-D-alanine carboxypeptidase family protein [Marivivens niveibacter]OUD10433.1 D-alanyl-D-alanine carboxypeptidase [Marivivens niveibacter]